MVFCVLAFTVGEQCPESVWGYFLFLRELGNRKKRQHRAVTVFPLFSSWPRLTAYTNLYMLLNHYEIAKCCIPYIAENGASHWERLRPKLHSTLLKRQLALKWFNPGFNVDTKRVDFSPSWLYENSAKHTCYQCSTSFVRRGTFRLDFRSPPIA